MKDLKPAQIRIRETLIDMMEEMPLASIRVKALAERAGVSRGTFYLYYESLFDVLQEIEDDFFEGLRTSGIIDTRERYAVEPEPMIIRNLDYVERNTRIVHVLLGYYGDGAFQAKIIRGYREQFQKYSPRFENPSGKAELVAEYLAGGQLSVMKHFADHPDSVNKEDIALIMVRMLRMVNQLMA